ncbi:MAG: UPF0182 family protein [Actinobacteria bacterium]|nr:UPF0182 family protein [Actinomycetota bacterium]
MRNPSDLPGNSPRIPRLKIRKPGRGRIAIIVVVAFLLLLILSARSLSSFYINVLWHRSLGRTDVYWGIVGTKVALIGAFTLIFALLLWVNLAIADRIAPVSVPDSQEQRALAQLRTVLRKRRRLTRTVIAIILGLVISLPASAQWENWMMFRNHKSFGVDDPLFGNDVGFYVFRLPFSEFIVTWFFGALVLVAIITGVLHYVNGSIRVQDPEQRVSPQAKVHVSVLLAGLALVRAADYWLQRFDLTRSTRGVVQGATYTDVKAQLPALNLMILVSIAVALLFLWNVRQRGWRLPVLAVGLWAIVALVAGTVYPAIIQRFVVQPNVSSRELPYIERNLDATKAALGLDTVDKVDFEVGDIGTKDVEANVASLRDVRQLEPTQMRDRFSLDQGLTSFYAIRDLDVDRYSIDGRLQQVMLATRELNSAGIPNGTWVSRHLLYTHGCGVVAAPASSVTSDGRPVYIDLGVKRPELYFGNGPLTYAITNTGNSEQPCANVKAQPYAGKAGIKLDGTLKRIALAINFGEYNLFGSRLIDDKSQILLVRDVRDRVEKLAPFLTFDADPYPVVHDGKVDWVIDAFTSTSRYPYAQRANTDQLTPGGGLSHSFNYARNIIRMWRDVFPKLFTDGDKAPKSLSAHFRYPEDLFRVQTNVYAKYHFDDPSLFFNRDGAWSVAQAPPLEPEQSTALAGGLAGTATGTGDAVDVQEANVERFEPYYTIFHDPTGKAKSPTFSMLRPFVPFSADDARKELRSMMVVSSDPDSFGRLTLYEFNDPLPPGPATVAAQFDSDPIISQTITPLDLRGSRVVFGDLQIVPVGKGLVYVRPLFVRPDDSAARQVFVRKVLASYGDQSVIADSVTLAIGKLFAGFDTDLGDRVDDGRAPETPETGTDSTTDTGAPDSGTTGSGTTDTTTPDTTGQTPAQLLARADELFAEADAALAQTPPDFAAFQEKQAAARELIRRALQSISG